jgi:cell division protein FtsZ
MVDERLEDEVWVTVVATGFGGPAARPPRPRLEEPQGEPRVQRRAGGREPAPPRRTGREPVAPRRTGLGVTELDVPEFIPRG